MSNERLFRMFLDCGCLGFIDGLFIARQEDVAILEGKTIDFCEALGERSEVLGTVGEDLEIEPISDDQGLIAKLKSVFSGNTVCGYNPLEYIEEEDA